MRQFNRIKVGIRIFQNIMIFFCTHFLVINPAQTLQSQSLCHQVRFRSPTSVVSCGGSWCTRWPQGWCRADWGFPPPSAGSEACPAPQQRGSQRPGSPAQAGLAIVQQEPLLVGFVIGISGIWDVVAAVGDDWLIPLALVSPLYTQELRLWGFKLSRRRLLN